MPLVLITRLAALADAVAELRRGQQHAAQAAAARTAAQQLYAAAGPAPATSSAGNPRARTAAQLADQSFPSPSGPCLANPPAGQPHPGHSRRPGRPAIPTTAIRSPPLVRRSGWLLGQVAQECDVSYLPQLREMHTPGVAMREAAGQHEPWRVRVADEERRDGEVDFVGQVGGKELGMDGGAAFDHELPDTAFPEIVHHRTEVE